MNGPAADRRTRRAARTARHAPCMLSKPCAGLPRCAFHAPLEVQGIRPVCPFNGLRRSTGPSVPAHPCRQSQGLQARARRAPGWTGQSLAVFARLGVAPLQTLAIPGSRWSASAVAQAGRYFTPANRKPQGGQSGDIETGGQGLTVRRLITPHPPEGGSGRPSNIRRDYAHISYVSGGGRAVRARLHPRPRNQRYVKWPRRPAGCLCVLRTPGPGVFARYRGSAPGPSRAPPARRRPAGGCGRFASFACARRPPPL